MALTLRITNYELGGDILFQSTTRGVLQYVPQAPAAADAESVTESFTVYFDDNAQAARGTDSGDLTQLERYFERARRHRLQRTGHRIFIEIRAIDSDDLYRSEILDGRIVWGSATLGAAMLPSDRAEVQIIITRRAYWEAAIEQELPLYNASVAEAATGGIAIVNHNDSGTEDDNWVHIDGADVEGNLPAPLRIRWENESNITALSFWMAHTVETLDGTLSDQIWTLEGESAGGGGSPTVGAGYSGTGYMSDTFTDTAASAVFNWTLDGAWLANAGGNPFRAVGKFVLQSYDNFYTRLVITSLDGVLYESPWVLARDDDDLVDYGTIPSIPPRIGGVSATDYADHKVLLEARRATTGTHTIRLDCIHLFPCDGGLRLIEAVTNVTGVTQNEFLMDDGIDGRLYRTTTGGEQRASFIAIGQPLAVIPGRDQRISFLWRDSNLAATATWGATVRAYYRPRRVTL